MLLKREKKREKTKLYALCQATWQRCHGPLLPCDIYLALGGRQVDETCEGVLDRVTADRPLVIVL